MNDIRVTFHFDTKLRSDFSDPSLIKLRVFQSNRYNNQTLKESLILSRFSWMIFKKSSHCELHDYNGKKNRDEKN